MPSPTSTIVPTPETSAPSSNPLISLRMIDVISSDRIAMKPSRYLMGLSASDQPRPEPLQAVPHAAVIERVADAHRDPADERFVDRFVHLDPLAGELRRAV